MDGGPGGGGQLAKLLTSVTQSCGILRLGISTCPHVVEITLSPTPCHRVPRLRDWGAVLCSKPCQR